MQGRGRLRRRTFVTIYPLINSSKCFIYKLSAIHILFSRIKNNNYVEKKIISVIKKFIYIYIRNNNKNIDFYGYMAKLYFSNIMGYIKKILIIFGHKISIQ